jgi:hypothetical protein
MEQTGAIAAGSFFERKRQNSFTWIRSFHTIEARAVANAAFYYGPVWREHRTTLNDLRTDSDNVMLLRPLAPEQVVTILPAVDPVTEAAGAEGIVVAQIFAVKANSVEGQIGRVLPGAGPGLETCVALFSPTDLGESGPPFTEPAPAM